MGRVISGRGRPNISAAKPAYLNQNSRPRCSATAAASSAFGLRQRRAPVQQHGKKQQRQRPQPRAGIEKQAEREQHKIPAAAKAPGQYEIQRDNGG